MMKNIRTIWDNATIKKRKELLKIMGYKTEWARLKFNEIGKRGGGILLSDLARLNKMRMKKNKGSCKH